MNSTQAPLKRAATLSGASSQSLTRGPYKHIYLHQTEGHPLHLKLSQKFPPLKKQALATHYLKAKLLSASPLFCDYVSEAQRLTLRVIDGTLCLS